MRAVILAGGLGTRLRPYTTVLPKPLVPVGDKPILEHILRQLGRAGFTRADLCVSHLGELIQVYLQQGAVLPESLRLHFHWEREPLGTAGALNVVEGLGGTFLVMNGDILTSLDYGALVAFHEQQGAALTIAMHRQEVKVSLGVIETEGSRVTGFIEKPTLDYEVSMGIYVYDERVLAYLPSGPCQFPDLVLRLVAAGEHVAAFRSDATWYDIGTLPEYEKAVAALEEPGSPLAADL